MPTRKIADPPKPPIWTKPPREQRPCLHPEHDPPKHMVFQPGSGCDSWEAAGLSNEEIREVMRKPEVSVWFDDLEHAHNWMKMIESTMEWGINELFGLDWYDAGKRMEGLHKALGLPEFDWDKWRERLPPSERPKRMGL